MSRVERLLRFWWQFDGRVSRRAYLRHGVSLAVLKYAGDAAIVWLATGQLWTPDDYLLSASSLFTSKIAGAPAVLLPALSLWTLPFLWIGVTLTARRAVDAGRSPWWAFGFFVPYLNYALMAALCLQPTRPDLPEAAPQRVSADAPAYGRLNGGTAVVAVAAGVALGLVMILISVAGLKTYGVALFMGTPFTMGAVTGFIVNHRRDATSWETLQLTVAMLGIAAFGTFVFAFEGAVCVFMALPLVIPTGLLGAVFGRMIAGGSRRDAPQSLFGVLVLPLWIALQPAGATGRAMHEVISAVEIEAAPDRVWTHVVAFQPMPDPKDLVFRSGIAYPRYARIEGTGVGAVRYCVFSTGEFVEPITIWQPGQRLAFDVTSSPPPMRELSPYTTIAPPHLDGYLRSRRGEFRLIALPGGRTRLEGSTWYQLDMGPEAYWQVLSDALIHRIHQRVLDHIKREAEGR